MIELASFLIARANTFSLFIALLPVVWSFGGRMLSVSRGSFSLVELLAWVFFLASLSQGVFTLMAVWLIGTIGYDHLDGFKGQMLLFCLVGLISILYLFYEIERKFIRAGNGADEAPASRLGR